MARIFRTSGVGVTQSLSIAEDNSVIRNYATEDAIATAIANDELDLGQVVSCTDTLCLYRIIVDPDDETSTTYEKITGGGEGAPLGSITSYEGSTVPAGYLECDGSTFDADRYPALAMLLGSNVLPEIFDHNKLGDVETAPFTNPYGSTETMQYDGVYSVAISSTGSVKITINNVMVGVDSAPAGDACNTTAEFKKGDVVKVQTNGTMQVNAIRYYKKHMAIKATSSYASDTENTLFNQIKDYVDNSQSYSTTETLTGGTWIDGKPIYRIAYPININVMGDWRTTNIPNPYWTSYTGDIDRIINCYSTDAGPEGLQVWMADSSQYFQVSVGVGKPGKTSGAYIIIEYTKTTD